MIQAIKQSRLLKYTLKRMVLAILVLLLVSVVVFAAVRLCPGDPVAGKIGAHGDFSEENYNRVAAELGLDKPFVVQYFIWLRDFLRGDFGKSLLNGADIKEIILQKLPITLELLLISMLLATLLAVLFGVTSAIYKDSWFDQFIRFLSTGFLAVPGFCLGIIMLLIFAVKLRLLPSMGYAPLSQGFGRHFRFLVMPMITMALMEQAALTRYIRSEMLEVLGSNYIRTAKAKGLTKRMVYYRHAFKNVLVTVVTLLGMRIGQLVGGAVVIEQVFGWPGIGWYLYSSISSQDYPAVQAIVLLIAVIMVLLNMLCDILYAVIDPRIKLS